MKNKPRITAAVLAILTAPICSPDDAMNYIECDIETAGFEEAGHLHDGSNGMHEVIAQFYDGEDARFEMN